MVEFLRKFKNHGLKIASFNRLTYVSYEQQVWKTKPILNLCVRYMNSQSLQDHTYIELWVPWASSLADHTYSEFLSGQHQR